MKKQLLILVALMFVSFISLASAGFEWNDGTVTQYYKLDGTSGVVVDTTGINNGTILGSVTRGVDGKIVNAFDINSATANITASTQTNIYNLNSSYSMWVKVDDNSTRQLIFSIKGASAGFQDKIYIDSGFFAYSSFDGATKEITGNTSVNEDEWYHITAYNYNGSTNYMYLYVNGVYNGRISYGTKTVVSGATQMSIGDFDTQTGFTGLIDELGIWNRTLSITEIQSLYLQGNGLPYETEVGLILHSPNNATLVSSGTISLNATGLATGNATLVNTTNYIWFSNGTLIASNTTTGLLGTSDNRNYTIELPFQGTYIWNRQYCDSDNSCNFAIDNNTLTLDSTFPIIINNYPTSLIDYGAVGGLLQFNTTFTDTNLASAWYNYNGTNITLTGVSSGTPKLFNVTLSSKKNITIYANDTAGNLNTSTFSWDYKVFENSRTYNSVTLEGAIESYSVNLTLYSGYEISSSNFYYNGTNYGGVSSISSSGSTRILSVSNFEVPDFTANTNSTFFWQLTLTDATQINLTNLVQLVNIVELDNCGSYSNQLFNLSLFDEQTLNALNGSIELYFDILNSNYQSVKTYTFSSNNTHNTLVCSGSNITNTSSFYSAEIRYGSTGYATELYHIQRATISQSANVSLYPLNLNSSTEFKITYQDDNFNFVEGAILQLQRKYIGEDVYRVVEAPLTSDEGIAVVHIDLNSIKYKATIVKNGEILDIFDNLVFKCQSELTGECEQKLLGEIDPRNIISYDTERDFIYTVIPGADNITVSFTVPSGVPANVNIELTQKDQFGNSTLCNQSIISSAGSVQCGFNQTLTQSYIEFLIYKDGEPVGYHTYVVDDNTGFDFLDNNYIIVLVLILSVVGMALSSPEWIVMNGIVVLLLSGLLWLVNGINFVAGLGILMWLVIAAGILILKLSKQEDR